MASYQALPGNWIGRQDLRQERIVMMFPRTIPEMEHTPKCRDGHPCPLPEPVRTRLPQTTGCEGCRRTFLLVTYSNPTDGYVAFWCPKDEYEEHLRQWDRFFFPGKRVTR